MNKGLRTAVTCVMIYVLSFGLTAAVTGEGSRSGREASAESDITVMGTSVREPSYTVREHNGVVAVFITGEDKPAIETDIFVSSLRAQDRELLGRGITKETYTEVLYLLEDLDS